MTSKKVIVITGASRGIGYECATKLANADSHLILIARHEDNLVSIKEVCENKGALVTCVGLDLANTKDIALQMGKIIKEVGKVDVLVNNAGIWLEKPLLEGSMSDWDTALDVNLKSVIHMTRHCLEVMPEGGAIIFIASIASRKTYYGGTNYCAAKWGILGFAGSLFEEVKEKGIKVSSILPGLVNTDMHKGDAKLDDDKMIQPEDIAQTVDFILQMPARVCPTEITLWPQKNAKKI